MKRGDFKYMNNVYKITLKDSMKLYSPSNNILNSKYNNEFIKLNIANHITSDCTKYLTKSIKLLSKFLANGISKEGNCHGGK